MRYPVQVVILETENAKLSVVVLNAEEKLVHFLGLGLDESAITLPKPSEGELSFLHVGRIESFSGAAGTLGPDELTPPMQKMMELPALRRVDDVVECPLELGSKTPVLRSGFFVGSAGGRGGREVRVEY
jgi:hypothetical protein